MDLRICKKCERQLPATSEHFYSHPNGRNGLTGKCKDCTRKEQYARFELNRELRKAQKREWYNVPEHRALAKQRAKEYAQTHRSECIARAVAHQKASKSTPLGYIKRLYSSVKSRCKRFGIEFDLDVKYLLQIFEAQNGKCAIFGDELTFISGAGMVMTNPSVDRINPLGGYTKDNVQLVCLQANIMKCNMDMTTFIARCHEISAKFEAHAPSP